MQTARLLLLQLLLVVVNIIRILSDSPQPYNEKNTTKSNKARTKTNLRRQYKTRKNMYVFMWPFISPMTSKKYHIYKRYEIKWPIVLQIYIVWPLPPSFFTSLLMSSSQWVHLTCPEASVLLNVPPGYFSFAFNYKDTAATQLLPQQATTHTNTHTFLSPAGWYR